MKIPLLCTCLQVMQYNPFESEDHSVQTQSATDNRVDNHSNGSIIAVSYEARAAGVKRIMRGREARRACPELQMVQVPTRHGKADLEIYRAAGAEVVNILMTGGITERASVDEAYVDVTVEATKRLKIARAAGDSALRALLERAAAASAGSGDPGPHISAPELDQGEDPLDEQHDEGDETVRHCLEDVGGAASDTQATSAASGHASASGNFEGTAKSSAPAVMPQLVSRDDVRQGHAGQGAQPTARSASTLRWWARPVVIAEASTALGRGVDDGGLRWREHEVLLAAGSLVVAELRAAVRNKLGYSCSAGVAHNKILAKLGCGLHKPNQQTLVPLDATAALLAPLDLTRLRGLGAKLGERVKKELGCNTVGELAAVPVARLIDIFGAQTATQLDMLARGEDTEEVKNRALPKSIGCGKVFNRSSWKTGANSPFKSDSRDHLSTKVSTSVGGAAAGPRVWLLRELSEVETWVRQLANEQAERLARDRTQYSRVARSLTVSVSMECESGPPEVSDEQHQQQRLRRRQLVQQAQLHSSRQGRRVSMSKSCRLRYGADEIFDDAMAIMRRWLAEHRGFGVSSLYLTGTDFSKVGGADISKYLRPSSHTSSRVGSFGGAAGDATTQGGAGDSAHKRRRLGDAVESEALLAASTLLEGGVEEDILAEDDELLDDDMCSSSILRADLDGQKTLCVSTSTSTDGSPPHGRTLVQPAATGVEGAKVVASPGSNTSPPTSSLLVGSAGSNCHPANELSLEQRQAGADVDTQRYLEASKDLDVATFFALPEALRTELVRDWKRATAAFSRANSAARGSRKISAFFSKR